MRDSEPGMRSADPEYEKRIEANQWHDREEFDEFVAAIKRLSGPDADWSWSRNTTCKYVELRIDMRDGGFVLTGRDGRISLKMLEWQYGKDRK